MRPAPGALPRHPALRATDLACSCGWVGRSLRIPQQGKNSRFGPSVFNGSMAVQTLGSISRRARRLDQRVREPQGLSVRS